MISDKMEREGTTGGLKPEIAGAVERVDWLTLQT